MALVSPRAGCPLHWWVSQREKWKWKGHDSFFETLAQEWHTSLQVTFHWSFIHAGHAMCLLAGSWLPCTAMSTVERGLLMSVDIQPWHSGNHTIFCNVIPFRHGCRSASPRLGELFKNTNFQTSEQRNLCNKCVRVQDCPHEDRWILIYPFCPVRSTTNQHWNAHSIL